MLTSKKQREKDFEDLSNMTEKDMKVKITTYIDSDVYLELHKLAKQGNTKYQTLLNEILRNTVFKKENELEQIKERLAKIEKKLNKAA